MGVKVGSRVGSAVGFGGFLSQICELQLLQEVNSKANARFAQLPSTAPLTVCIGAPEKSKLFSGPITNCRASSSEGSVYKVTEVCGLVMIYAKREVPIRVNRKSYYRRQSLNKSSYILFLLPPSSSTSPNR